MVPFELGKVNGKAAFIDVAVPEGGAYATAASQVADAIKNSGI